MFLQDAIGSLGRHIVAAGHASLVKRNIAQEQHIHSSRYYIPGGIMSIGAIQANQLAGLRYNFPRTYEVYTNGYSLSRIYYNPLCTNLQE